MLPGLDVTVYPVIAAPPFDDGTENATDACAFPAVAEPIVGAPGTTALTVKLLDTCVAAKKLPLPAWSALIVAVPTVTNVNTPPLVTVHTPVVLLVKLTVSPDDDVAVSVGDVPKFWAPGFAKVMICAALGVTLEDDDDAELVPALFVAVTVNV
jgi:hypothetical protein